MLQRPARSVLTALGTVLGVGTFVAILGLTATTSSRIDSRFDLLTATEVTVEDISVQQNAFAGPAFPADADGRIERLGGVENAGVYWTVHPAGDATVRSSPVGGASGGEETGIVAASPGAILAADPHLAQGRLYDGWMLISTRIGAAGQIAHEAPTALRPDHPEYLKAVPPPDPRTLRGSVTGDLNQLFLLLAAICLVIGAVGIANTTLVAVLERTGEIGLRRALGARGRHITAQFLAESGALGALGGLVGTSLGSITVVIVAVIRDWTPVLHPATVAAAPAIGLLTGLLAGLYPALRAAHIQPAEALRR
ncbi:ABC transporter permease [Streptomyces sp. H10-C2]|nr:MULTISPECIES: ABC transporter permease [unclassified Streptomyces]MDJ0341983.1 ABC transporter permease [Streptomyces sp. PH10-H1]MDJ0369956.1 ABC transporter permease [Streptomyces sp. H10-C2]MDJ0370043.1 ABC transporter permease [Streptomyces sp. H10-C2]